MDNLDDLIILLRDAELKEVLLNVTDKEIFLKVSERLIKNKLMTPEQKKKIDILNQQMPAELVAEKNKLFKQLLNK